MISKPLISVSRCSVSNLTDDELNPLSSASKFDAFPTWSTSPLVFSRWINEERVFLTSRNGCTRKWTGRWQGATDVKSDNRLLSNSLFFGRSSEVNDLRMQRRTRICIEWKLPRRDVAEVVTHSIPEQRFKSHCLNCEVQCLRKS